MSDARLPMLDADAALAAGRRVGVPDALAQLNVFRVLLRRERLAKGVTDVLLSLLFGGELDDRLRELVIMRIGWATGSVYEWTQHWQVATDLGVSADDLIGVRDWASYGAFGELERSVLAATDECLAGDRIADETMAVLRRHLSDNAVIELVGAIGAWSMISTLLRTVDVPLDDGLDPWPPDGTGP